MATKEKEVKREVKFEYCSELSVDESSEISRNDKSLPCGIGWTSNTAAFCRNCKRTGYEH